VKRDREEKKSRTDMSTNREYYVNNYGDLPLTKVTEEFYNENISSSPKKTRNTLGKKLST
jgi:hypothetical protein